MSSGLKGADSNILMYITEDGITKVEVAYDNNTVWLSLDHHIVELFQRNNSTIEQHFLESLDELEWLEEKY